MKRLLLASLMVLVMAGVVMAGSVAPVEVSDKSPNTLGQCKTFTYTPLTTTNPTGVATDVHAFKSITLCVHGTWNGATFNIQGTLDPTGAANYMNLRDLSTLAAISLTADCTTICVVFESPVYFIQPTIGATGGASTSLTCQVMAVN